MEATSTQPAGIAAMPGYVDPELFTRDPELPGGRLDACLFGRLPDLLAVGRGTALLVRGLCAQDGHQVRSVRLRVEGGPGVGGVGSPAGTVRLRHGAEWWATVSFGPVSRPTAVRLILEAEMEGGAQESTEVAALRLTGGDASAAPGSPNGTGDEEIAICMATYNPRLDLFERQIESIREQTLERWTCVISDDASDPEIREGMRGIVGDDRRFHLVESPVRLGFYSNFERALGLAPAKSAYIALSDQDDRWLPNKLEVLAARLRAGASLAYGDMRIVKGSGQVLSNTYWKYRRNQFTDLASLLVGNTVTGSASMFRREILDWALPFPPRVGEAFHDHWLAVVALALGRIDYVNSPVQDYVQHPGAVMGFSGANQGRGQSTNPLIDRGLRVRRLGTRVLRPDARQRYFDDYCRVAVNARVLHLRCADAMTAERRSAVERLLASERSARAAGWLSIRAAQSLLGANDTMGVDRSLLAGLGWRYLAEARARTRIRTPIHGGSL